MNILCLCPTYGRRKDLLENMLACFISQTHKDKSLIVYDDSGILNECVCDLENVYIIATSKRAESLSNKYNEMVDFANKNNIEYDAVAMFDDDDVYLPKYLEAHAKTMEENMWSKPSKIISAYLNPPIIEDARGRFYGSLALTKYMLDLCEWPRIKNIEYDQIFMGMLNKISQPGDTLKHFSPQYIYRWGSSRSNHCSGIAGDSNWYENYKGDSKESILELKAVFDSDSNRLMDIV